MQCLQVPADVKYAQNIAPVRFCNFNLENFLILCIMNQIIRLWLVNFVCMYMYIVR